MLGDSLVAGYDWQQRMPRFDAHNCGVPGATTRDLLHALPRIRKDYPSPDIIMVMIGTNDVIVENYGFINEIRKIFVSLVNGYPMAEILVNSLLPMQLPYLNAKAITRLNTHIADTCRQTGCCFIDLFDRFKQSNEILFQADGVHLTPQAYELWARTLMEHIAFLVESDYPA